MYYFMLYRLIILLIFFFLMIRRPPRSTLSSSSAASDVYKRQTHLVMVVVAVVTTYRLQVVGRDCVTYKRWWGRCTRRHLESCCKYQSHTIGAYVVLPQLLLLSLPMLQLLSLIHISEPTRLLSISYAVFCLKKKKKKIKC
eukprot:TRINITY_DN21348_c0_g1_i1.p1 TRINITY_DN21348_c0_g1~~TRINITY_DN21348_c0_g1_i1.p1  ORF type:complete len:141 (+),score=24.53 TRINITY_DN21348_c0_g1_i1:83-505(+)